jgi:ABC-type proline/glycine betaine transport system permease subunit
LFVAPAFSLTIAAGVAIVIVAIGLFRLLSRGRWKRAQRASG